MCAGYVQVKLEGKAIDKILRIKLRLFYAVSVI